MSSFKGKDYQKSKLDVKTKRALAFESKIEEYNKLSIEELETIIKDPKKRPGGVYKEAFLLVYKSKKLQEIKSQNQTETIDVESVEIIEENNTNQKTE